MLSQLNCQTPNEEVIDAPHHSVRLISDKIESENDQHRPWFAFESHVKEKNYYHTEQYEVPSYTNSDYVYRHWFQAGGQYLGQFPLQKNLRIPVSLNKIRAPKNYIEVSVCM